MAALSAGCLVAGVLAAWLMTRGGPAWPHQWDPRVASIAAFDESHRDLRFRHPVPVVFLSDAAFRQKLVGAGGSTTAKQRLDIQRVVEELRALGLTSGSPELLSGARNLVGTGVQGLYDFKAKKVWVRGDVMTPYVQVVLAHELTHVLQDQNFGVHHPKGDDADAAYTAVVEADAVRMQNLYLKSLTPADQHTYDQEQNATGTQVGNAASAVPAALVDSEQFPYQIGPHFVESLIAARGTGGLDDALRRPPTSTLEIIEPSRYLADTQVVPVGPPDLRPGEQRLEAPSTVGAFQVFEILADRLDTGRAWQAASTWAGDSSIVYRAQGRTCIRLDMAAHRGGVSRLNGNVRFDVCDPGPAATTSPPAAIGALDALDIRGQLADGIAASAKLQPGRVDCITDVVVAAAGNQGLKHIVDLANQGDRAGLLAFYQGLGTQARPAIQARCPAA
jgi:hypothetical protein